MLAIKLINICEDVLFHNKLYDPKGIIEKTIPSQKSFFCHSKIPLHAYLKKYSDSLPDFIQNNKCVINEIDDIYNASDRKTRLYRYPISKLNHIIGTSDPLDTKIKNIYYSLKALDINEVEEYIKSIWSQRNELKQKTYLTKIVCAIDLYKNKKEHK